MNESGVHVRAIELDAECVRDLKKLPLDNVEITHGDFLQFDLGTAGDTIRIIGNVPYQITTPIISRIFGEIGQPRPWLSNVKKLIMTVQYEVAERFVAVPDTSEYSQITLLVNYFAQSRILRKVPRDAFYPQPEVTSAVVEFTPLKEPAVSCRDAKLLRQLIKAGFGQRRKMLKNNLSFLHADPVELNVAFESAGINLQARAETLSLAQFARLSDALLETDKRHER